jgi:hypothetical protein
VVVLLAGTVTAGATGLWWLLGVTLALYAWLVRSAAAEAADPFAWEEPSLEATLSPRGRALATVVLDLCRKLHAELRTASAVPREALTPVWDEVRSLCSQHLVLVRRLDCVERYLEQMNASRVAAEQRELQSRRQATLDPTARAQYDLALQSLEVQQENLRELRTHQERVDAELVAIRHTLEGVYGRVVRLNLSDTQTGSRLAGELSGRLKQLTQRVTAVTEAVEEVYARLGANEA